MPKPRKLSSRLPWKKRADIVDRYMRIVFRKLERQGKLSAVHNLGHVNRVSHYARRYVEFMGGSKALQQQASISGKSHDRIRYPTEQVPHEKASGELMQTLFEKRYGKKAAKSMGRAIQLHGTIPGPARFGKEVVREGLFNADKYFEANGAYIGFRRPMFMAERKDRRMEAKKLGLDLRKPEDVKEAAIRFTLDETGIRVSKFSDLSKIPKELHGFVKYQVRWQERLRKGLQKRQGWAVNLVTELFTEGLKKHPRTLDEVIMSYEPVAKIDAEFKKEALRYFSGDLWKEFTKRVKKR